MNVQIDSFMFYYFQQLHFDLVAQNEMKCYKISQSETTHKKVNESDSIRSRYDGE